MSYQGGDSTPANWVAPDLGIRLNFYMDVMGGGSSTEALVGLAMGAIEAGMCHTVAIFRSMNGYSDVPHRRHRRPRRPARARARPGPGALRHAQRRAELRAHVHAPHVRVRHDVRAGRARAGRPQQARLPEPEGAPEGAGHRRRRAQLALDRASRCTCSTAVSRPTTRPPSSSPRPSGRAICGRSRCTSWAWPGASTSRARTSTGRTGPISRVAGYYAKDIVFGQAGIKPEDVDITGSYDAFTFTTMLQLEEYGFCKKGEGGAVRLERHHRAGRQAAEQHLGQPPLRGLHARHVDGDRERAPAPRHRGRLLPRLGGRQAHLRLLAEAVPAGEGRDDHDEPRLGHARHGLAPSSCTTSGSDLHAQRRIPRDEPGHSRERLRVARALQARARQPQADAPRLQGVRAHALSAESRLSRGAWPSSGRWQRGERARAHLLLRDRGPRHPARLQGVDALRGRAGRARRAARQADRATRRCASSRTS